MTDAELRPAPGWVELPNRWYVRRDSAEVDLSAIGRLVDSPELRRGMGTAARSWAERFAAPEACAARLGAIIGDVITGQRS